MAILSDKQFTAVAVVGGLAAWWMYRKSAKLVSDTKQAVSDSVDWYAYQAGQAKDAVVGVFLDDFDRNHMHTRNMLTPAQYERYKAAVQAGLIEDRGV